MKNKMNPNMKFLSVIWAMLVCNFLHAQQIHVDYRQTEGTAKKFSVEVWISSVDEEPFSISALNTVFDYSQNVFDRGELTFHLAPGFNRLVEPISSILQDRQKLRTTMIPVKNAGEAIKISGKPELFGTLTFTSSSFIRYPQAITPSVKGNPTVQALVYREESINSKALTLSQMTITTDESPLFLRLMPDQINPKHTWDEITIYPNPTTHEITYNMNVSQVDENAGGSIFDVQGRLLKSFDLQGQTTGTVDFSTYSPGIYYLVFYSQTMVERHKVIKI
jgi:hypothetical protein